MTLVQRIALIISNEGGYPGGNLHSWRCEYPGVYGPKKCNCLEQIAEQILAEIKDAAIDEAIAREREK